MKSESKVICTRCGNPIDALDDLEIRGLSYGIQALHSACYEKAKSQFIYRLSWGLRGRGFWSYLLMMNLLLVLCLIVFPNSWRDLRWFFLIVNVPQLFFRLVAFFSYELPLKNPTQELR